MSTETAEDFTRLLEFATKVKNYLGVTNLTKKLVDDKRNRIDSDARTEDETLIAHYKEDSLWGIKTARFLKDFHLYKAAPDMDTTNESFLRTAEIFRLQGIKNYYFILQLNNPMLKGLDPHSPDLTDLQKTMIAKECRENFWYFLREVCRIKNGLPFLANRGNISFMWSYLNHITTHMIMPRQQGKPQPDSSEVRVQPKNPEKAKPSDHWKKMGHLKVGDTVIDQKGEPASVIGVHPQGKIRVYRITGSDGRSTDAGIGHLWTMKNSMDSINERGLWGEYTTADLIHLLKQKAVLQFPLIEPEQGVKRNHAIDPYVMGLMAMARNTNGGLQFPILNDAQAHYVEANLPKYTTLVKGKGDWTFTLDDGKPITFDKEVGLPAAYLEGALEDRISLLQAFCDNLGTVGDKNVQIAVNRSIAVQLKYLVRGLGGTASTKGNGIAITLPDTIPYFKTREQERPVNEMNALFVRSIKYLWEEKSTCIEIDSSEHLYVTDDFMVTHNTVSVQVINFWLTYIMGRGYTSHLITLKSDNRAQFVNAIKTIRSSIPKFLVNSTYKDKDAGTSLTYKAFGDDRVNTLYINVPQQGADAAGDLARGLTVGSGWYDESAYIKYIDLIIDGSGPSMLTEMAACRAKGIPHGISHITTPNTTLHPSGAFMFKRLMDSTEWREKFFDCFSESDLHDKLIKASPVETTSPKLAMVYNYLQLGKDKDWVKWVIDDLNLSKAKAKIDLLLMWVEDGENRLFDDQTREAINNMKRDVVWSKEYKDFNLYMDFFVTQNELAEMCAKSYNDFFLIGSDTSSAINKDACTIVIRSMKTGKVIGVGRYALTYLDHVTSILVDLLECIQNSMLVPERNYAHHMIDTLLITLPAKGMDPFTRIYNTVYQDTVAHEKEYEEVRRTGFATRSKNFYLKFKQHFGFLTTGTSRKTLYGLIIEAVGNTGYGLAYSKLADELINLRLKADRIDHDSKQHDDLVISWLLSYWFIKLGMNKSLYGIPPGLALTETRNLMNESAGVKAPETEPHIIHLLQKVRAKITTLTDELLSTNDNLLALRLEAEIRKLTKYLPPEQARSMTIDKVIEDARMDRNKRIMDQRRVA